MSRLPVPGSDGGTWGDVLNDFLSVSHNSDGTLKYGTTSGTAAQGDDSRIVNAEQKTTLTTKGDLYVATASGITTRLPAGSNNQTLVADSTQTTGLKWSDTSFADPSALALNLVAHTFNPILAANNFVFGSGVFACCLVYLPALPVTKLGIGLRSSSSGPTGVNRMALYRLASPTSAVLVDQTVDMTTALTTAITPAVIFSNLSGGTQALSAGPYYICALTHFSSPGQVVVSPTADASFSANYPAVNGRFPTVYMTGQTSLPGAFDPTSASLNSGVYYFAAA